MDLHYPLELRGKLDVQHNYGCFLYFRNVLQVLEARASTLAHRDLPIISQQSFILGGCFTAVWIHDQIKANEWLTHTGVRGAGWGSFACNHATHGWQVFLWLLISISTTYLSFGSWAHSREGGGQTRDRHHTSGHKNDLKTRCQTWAHLKCRSWSAGALCACTTTSSMSSQKGTEEVGPLTLMFKKNSLSSSSAFVWSLNLTFAKPGGSFTAWL